MRMNGAGMFDVAWQQIQDGDTAPVISLANEAAETRAELCTRTSSMLEARRFASASLGAHALVESFGSNEAAQASCWLLLLQSIGTRAWLLQGWSAALNPTSETAASLARLAILEGMRRPSALVQPQILVELAFLQNSNIAWKR